MRVVVLSSKCRSPTIHSTDTSRASEHLSQRPDGAAPGDADRNSMNDRPSRFRNCPYAKHHHHHPAPPILLRRRPYLALRRLIAAACYATASSRSRGQCARAPLVHRTAEHFTRGRRTQADSASPRDKPRPARMLGRQPERQRTSPQASRHPRAKDNHHVVSQRGVGASGRKGRFFSRPSVWQLR
jgi:hypothetical protein